MCDKKRTVEDLKLVEKYLESGNVVSAKKILDKLINEGSAEAEYLCSTFSQEIESDEEYEKRRFELILSSAQKRYAPALYALGVFYDSGDYVKQNKIYAAKLFMDAATLGHPQSQYIHALDLLKGSNGISLNEEEGIKILKMSALQKFEGAVKLLSEFYAGGEHGLPKDVDESKKLLSVLDDPEFIPW